MTRHVTTWVSVFLLGWAARAASGAENENCLKCHTAIQAALKRKSVHPAVEMGCTSCHVDHQQSGARKSDKYLNAGQPELCLTCHDAQDQKLKAAHRNQPFESAICSRCHDPHSSDEPKLMHASQHPPFEARQCDSCHQQPAKGKVTLTAGSAGALCSMCHDELGKRIAASKSKHSLLSADPDACVLCHDPHASSRKAMLKDAQPALCGQCHADLTANKKFTHAPVEVACTLCHDAHASNLPKNLLAQGKDLCLECHGAKALEIVNSPEATAILKGTTIPAGTFKAVSWLNLAPDGRGHPLPGHPAFRAAAKDRKEIDCLTCHRAHAGNGSKRLLVTEQASDRTLCVRCH